MGRNGCIALHSYVHFLRIFSFVTRGIESEGIGARSVRSRLRLCNAQPARENVGIELRVTIYVCHWSMHPFRPTKPMIRICGIVGRNGCIALHYYVHFLRIFSFVTRGTESEGVGARSVWTRLHLCNAQPARENVGIELRVISLYDTGLTHSTI